MPGVGTSESVSEGNSINEVEVVTTMAVDAAANFDPPARSDGGST